MDISQDFSPGMLSFPDQTDFDYSAFLQAEDINFGESAQSQLQSTSDSSDKVTPPRSTSGSCSEVAVQRPSAQKQRLERRGHTKSRRGCYNCKRRRIKPHHQIPLFSLQDMRFFQHFLTQCYPHHPLKQEDIWTHEIPCIAHNNEYLMHAILGFSASELTRNDPSILSSAMNHRIKAIRAIKKRLAETTKSSMNYEEANAMVATCYALTFQSVSLEDGLAEYLTFIRGIMIVGMQMVFRGIKPIFENMFEQDQDALLEPLMQGLPLIPKGYTDSAMEALTNLRPLCAEGVELEYHQHLMTMVEKLYINSWDAYKAYTAQYGWWMLLPHDTFQALIDPDNQVMLLLHTHWVAINEIITPISRQDRNVSSKYPPDQREAKPDLDPGFSRWLKYLNQSIDLEHQIYNQWPMWVEEQLDGDVTFFGRVA
ncbi:hypothetical protein FSPOR_6771 [Fusarium sporotrichioides]|uniref:C6 transcription factor n=1 Tax=Fusarium sporotrichioides TaxID=5514 RepID=A0A395S1V4_FUSSP|nr:hypothetical protein FSPOR_6771 [Fusarium sporotrichioides]